MTAPNMAAITASLERSLQNCSLNHHHSSTSGGSAFGSSSTSSDPPQTNYQRSDSSSDGALELNSNISLPYHWEQCLDLKTGEVYYINWRTGMKAKEDPRTADHGFSGYYYSDDEDEDDESSYESEGSSSESSPVVSSSRRQNQNDEQYTGGGGGGGGHVLVVAGCKSCLMYFMVAKQVEECPKCSGQLIHFDRSDDNA